MQADPSRLWPSQAELKIIERINELHHREEIMWRQRSRIQWLAEGDRNTKFFHLRASQRRRKNLIKNLRKSNGEFTSDEREMGEMTTNFFYRNFYTLEDTRNMEAVLDSVPVKVSAEMNEGLMAPFTEKEIKDALFHMFPNKALGQMVFCSFFPATLGSLRQGNHISGLEGA